MAVWLLVLCEQVTGGCVCCWSAVWLLGCCVSRSHVAVWLLVLCEQGLGGGLTPRSAACRPTGVWICPDARKSNPQLWANSSTALWIPLARKG